MTRQQVLSIQPSRNLPQTEEMREHIKLAKLPWYRRLWRFVKPGKVPDTLPPT